MLISVNEECFWSEETGGVNITQLERWLRLSSRKPELSALYDWNVKELLKSHEFDSDVQERLDRITDQVEADGKIHPLILHFPDGPKAGATMYIIDGWHRLLFLSKVKERLGARYPHKDFIGFPAYWVTKAECERFALPKEAMRDRVTGRKAYAKRSV